MEIGCISIIKKVIMDKLTSEKSIQKGGPDGVIKKESTEAQKIPFSNLISQLTEQIKNSVEILTKDTDWLNQNIERTLQLLQKTRELLFSEGINVLDQESKKTVIDYWVVKFNKIKETSAKHLSTVVETQKRFRGTDDPLSTSLGELRDHYINMLKQEVTDKYLRLNLDTAWWANLC